MLLVFPALAIVVSVGCSGVSGARNTPAKVATTTVKKLTATTILPSKSTATTIKPKSTVGANQTALSVLKTIRVEKEHPVGYVRTLFKHWIDANGNSCNTREEVLIAESLTHAQVDAYGCKVVAGDWLSPYDNVTHTDPSELDVDHMVPLKEAWDSGAWNWTTAQRQTFANDLSDPRPLIAVTAGQNRSKGAKDPSNWIPPQSGYVCVYLAEWIAIKAKWSLSMDQSEFGRIRNLLNASCPTTTIAPWGSRAATPKGTAPIVTTPKAITSPTSQSTTTVTQPASVGVRQVTPVRCKSVEAGLLGQYKGIAYVCSSTRQNGQAYVVGYYYWRPA